MRLDKRRDAELAKRKGATRRTIIQLIWLAISLVVAYVVAVYVIFAPEGGVLSYDEVYRLLSLSRDQAPEVAILGGVMLIIVFIMQFFLLIGFFLTAPEGRRRTGTPSLYSRNQDPFDNRYD